LLSNGIIYRGEFSYFSFVIEFSGELNGTMGEKASIAEEGLDSLDVHITTGFTDLYNLY